MKENILVEMRNKVDAVSRVMQNVINELTTVRDMAVGSLEVIKKLPGYDKAIEELKNEMIEANKLVEQANEKIKSTDKKLEL
tara:strand:+ start:1090 stop:1335 length:246 start_codon:yes stop_codon:yes gene_type:complete